MAIGKVILNIWKFKTVQVQKGMVLVIGICSEEKLCLVVVLTRYLAMRG